MNSWESVEHDEAYRAFRAGEGKLTEVPALLSAPPVSDAVHHQRRSSPPDGRHGIAGGRHGISDGRHRAAVDDDVRAHHRGRRIGHQEADHRRDLGGQGGPAQRDLAESGPSAIAMPHRGPRSPAAAIRSISVVGGTWSG